VCRASQSEWSQTKDCRVTVFEKRRKEQPEPKSGKSPKGMGFGQGVKMKEIVMYEYTQI
jgi:hypothetical protein